MHITRFSHPLYFRSTVQVIFNIFLPPLYLKTEQAQYHHRVDYIINICIYIFLALINNIFKICVPFLIMKVRESAELQLGRKSDKDKDKQKKHTKKEKKWTSLEQEGVEGGNTMDEWRQLRRTARVDMLRKAKKHHYTVL